MIWESFFRIQTLFSTFLAVPIEFHRSSYSFEVAPCDTLWKKIKQLVLTNLCLFVIWGMSLYRILRQLLLPSDLRDVNFTISDLVIISIALAFCTEGLAHIWTFHWSAPDICYVLTQTLKLTKLYCYGNEATRLLLQDSEEGGGENTKQPSLAASYTTGTIVKGKATTSKRNADGDLRETKPTNFLSKSTSFPYFACNLTKEELIMYGIAVGFMGVPLVCFLTPLMTPSDPASYFMKNLIFPDSPVIAMLTASIFQGTTAFYTSMLSLNLILICLTVVCQISEVLQITYHPQGKKKWGKWRFHQNILKIEPTSGKGFLWGKASNVFTPSSTNSTKNCARGKFEIESVVQEALVMAGKRGIGNYFKRNDKTGTGFLPQNSDENDKVEKGQSVTEKRLDLGKSCKSRDTQAIPSNVFTLTKTEQQGKDDENFCRVFQVLPHPLHNQNKLLPPSSTSSLHSEVESSFRLKTSHSQSNVTVNSVKDGMRTSGKSCNEQKSLAPPPPPPSPSLLMMKLIKNPKLLSSSPTFAKLPPLDQVEPLFQKSLKLYHQTKLLVVFINFSMFYYFPVVISAGMALSTLSAYATVKLHRILPLPITLSIALIGVTVVLVMWLLMNESTEITRHSTNFLRCWKQRLTSSYSRRQLRSCQTLCFAIGPFLKFKKDTIFDVFSTIQHYTVNLAVIQF